MDLRNCLPRDYRLFIDRHWSRDVGREGGREVRASLREVVDLPDKLDRVVWRRSSMAGGFDLHESFNGQ